MASFFLTFPFLTKGTLLSAYAFASVLTGFCRLRLQEQLPFMQIRLSDVFLLVKGFFHYVGFLYSKNQKSGRHYQLYLFCNLLESFFSASFSCLHAEPYLKIFKYIVHITTYDPLCFNSFILLINCSTVLAFRSISFEMGKENSLLLYHMLYIHFFFPFMLLCYVCFFCASIIRDCFAWSQALIKQRHMIVFVAAQILYQWRKA